MVTDRRRFERFSVLPMYTEVAVRLLSETAFTRSGHAYDLSEGGMRFELDEPIDPGTPVAVMIALPNTSPHSLVDGPGRAVFAVGNVVWTQVEADEPGPYMMALAITRFSREGDRERLINRLTRGHMFQRVA